jgi:lipopolysaccharide export system permease protein
MSAINRYIVVEFLKVFLIALIALAGVLTFTDVVKELQNEGLGFMQIAMALPYLLPYALRTSIQGAMLFAACYVYGRLAATNELVAVKSMGISPLRVIWPALAMSIPLSLFCVWLDDVGAHWGHDGLERVLVNSTDEVAYGMLRTHRSFSKKHFAIAVKNVEGRTLIRPTLTYEPPGEAHVVTIIAKEGELRVDRASSRLSILLRSGRIFVPGKFEMSFEDTIEPTLPLDTRFAKKITSAKIAEQRARVETLKKNLVEKVAPEVSTDRTAPYLHQTAMQRLQTEERYLFWMQTKLHQKWSNSFCCLAFMMIGVPVAVRMRRADFLTGFVLCFMPIVALYQPLQFFGTSLAQSGNMPPWMVWFGNLLLMGIGAWLLKRVVRH